jgi:hypothetical protein
MSRDIRGVRVTPEGSIASRFTVNQRGEDDMFADLAFDGARYLVAYNDSREGTAKIFYTLVEPDGTVLDDSGVRVTGQESLAIQGRPSVVFGRDNFLVTWLGSRPLGNVVLGVRIGTGGGQIDPAPIEFSPDSLLREWVVVASDGEDYMLAWTAHAAGPGSDLFFRRFSHDGRMLDPLPVLIAHSDEYICEPALAFLHDRYLLAWVETSGGEQDVRASRILRDGRVLDPAGFDIGAGPGTQRQPDIAPDSTRFFVLWSDNARGDFDVLAAFVDSSGTVGVEESRRLTADNRQLPTIVRGVLWLPEAPSRKPQAASLLDVSGRCVMSLRPGLNDVTCLAPGVYLARSAAVAAGRKPETVERVVIIR